MPENSIVKQIDNPELASWEAKTDLIKRTVAVGATNDELALFFHQARRTGLDPLARQIYYVKRQGKGTIQVGIDGFRLIAHRSGECAGIDDAVFEGKTGNFPDIAKVTVYRMVQGQRCPFTATARWTEYYPGDAQGFQWKKMPHTMLAKCAEALALRKAFPAELSGLYVSEEMSQAGPYSGQVNESTGEVIEAELVEEPQQQPRQERPKNPAPEGVTLWGYVPDNWPGSGWKTADPSEKQQGMIAKKVQEWDGSIDVKAFDAAVAAEADVPANSKASASLAIDLLMNGPHEAIEAALEKAAEYMSDPLLEAGE
jgi:phage recombination protein Bet